ncbi:hypothetical protein [Blastopirellula marina]|uniref:Core-binding (CB) domain-containing protein n=1 Tax=Blastopirellula marina DSM 3645 TaxID=314230 RepID=A3ZSF0_9BACT|nr:hypothetical protein [Blastopirellula marina]EAQ80610.1 hypothetical protein DSM3645_14730 [Blastopirellula marina DSM 3645]
MATRSRRTWKPDARGYYSRQLGWERTQSGKLQQHKFLLGTDRKEAEHRERKLKELWDRFCESCDEPRPLWTDHLLMIAKRIAKGIPNVPVRRGADELQYNYAGRIQRMQAKYPVVLFLPEDQYAFDVGQAALEMFEAIPGVPRDMIIKTPDIEVLQAAEETKERLAGLGIDLRGETGLLATPDIVKHDPYEGVLKPSDPVLRRAREQKVRETETTERARSVGNVPSPAPLRTLGATLYQALTAYEKYLEKEYFDPNSDHISAWGKTQVRQVKNLKNHHPDLFLSRLDSDALGELVGYWRRRPFKTGTTVPMTAKSASNYLGTLVRFFKWLDKSSKYQWNKPFAFSDMDTKIRRLASDLAKKSIEQVDTFSLDELRLLMRYGKPFDRILLLLGLNCGFGRAEIGSLLVGEVHLFKGHTEREQEILDFPTTDKDSFIKRIRRKSGVYGEHILFPQTVEAIKWAMEHRQRFPDFSPAARLVVSENGSAIDRPTKSNNANQLIPNHFDRLIQRIQDDKQQIRKLSFGKLRKTATDLVKRFSNGEIAGVFDCHGSPVKTDSLSDQYSNRPFGKVFQAIREVEAYLAPVFAEGELNAV